MDYTLEACFLYKFQYFWLWLHWSITSREREMIYIFTNPSIWPFDSQNNNQLWVILSLYYSKAEKQHTFLNNNKKKLAYAAIALRGVNMSVNQLERNETLYV